jgi:hypothetical protein
VSASSAPSEASSLTVATSVPTARVLRSWIPVWSDRSSPSPVTTLSATTEFGSPRVLLVSALATGWVQVELPARPNGSIGWVHQSDVELGATPDVILVDRATRELSWYHAGRLARNATVAVGAPSTPTPSGTFFVTDVLAEDSQGQYGAWLLALNGHSEALQTFDGGDPRIAIHGTNEPSSIGGATSNGCVRLGAADLAALAAAIQPGTPVVVS